MVVYFFALYFYFLTLLFYLYYFIIMQLSVYNGEVFERGLWWRMIMWILFVVLVVVTLFSSKILGGNDTLMPDWTDVLSVLLLIALFASYWFYVRKEIEKKIIVRLDPEQGLWIWDTLYQWHAVQWFSLEMERKTEKLHNIIFLVNQGYKIHTLADTPENIDTFIHTLAEYTSFQETFSQERFNKLLRRLKI